jgi:hypothetical protein
VKRLLLLAGLVLLGALAYRNLQRDTGAVTPGTTALACTCAEERGRNGWCAVCSRGYAAGLEVRSKLVHEALDLHGHDVQPEAFECPRCREALAGDGFCADCARGFVGGRAYLSPLAYSLARGEPAAVEDDLRVLERALEMVERCELCAAALVVRGTCPECRISYEE